MKKRVVSLICAFAIVLGMVIPSTSHVHAATDTTCAGCGAEVTEWTALTSSTTFEAGGHYRLESALSKRHSISTAGTVCIDLAGQTWSYSARALLVGDGSTATVLNIIDSSAEGTGIIEGTGDPAYSGGVVYIYKKATLNLHGGTIQPSSAADVVAYSGGAMVVHGTCNMSGGKVIGGLLGGTKTPKIGGAILVSSSGTFNMSGGVVKSGTAPSDEAGHCVYVNGGSATLSGDASADEIALSSATDLTISGTYTGTVALRSIEAVSAGGAVAVSDNADISGAKITIAGSDLAPTVSGSNIVLVDEHWCEACRKSVEWQGLSGAIPNAAGHYCLTQNVSASQVSLNAIGGAICLDLAGYTYTSTGRAVLLYDVSGDDIEDTLNIMDSSAGKTGALYGQGGSTSYASGVFRTYSNTVLNLYDGTVGLIDNGNVVANDGGVVVVGGEVNMYGGKMVGGNVADLGGTVFVYKGYQFNMYGGVVESGSAANLGDCIYVENGGYITLSGDASPEQIYFAGSSASTLTVTGNYTGTVELKYATAPTVGTDIGNCSSAVVGKENITIADTRFYAAVSDTNLVVTELTGASVTNGAGSVTYYDTLAEAIAARTSGSVVKLLADNAENVTITGDLTLDLNGWDLSGNVTVSGGTLYIKDSCTDDFDVDDAAGYGQVIGTITGNTEAVKNYLELTEASGTSYHKLVLEITKINLRPGSAGLYYSSDIKLSSALLELVDSYGIAVSTNSEIPTADPDDAYSLYTAFTADQYGTKNTNSVLIEAVMETSNDAKTNATYANTVVYGRPYIRLADDADTCFYGDICSASLQQLTEAIDAKAWENLSLTQNRALLSMYDTYAEAMAEWKLTNIGASVTAAAEAAEDRVLKVLVIGNSHGLDSTNLLYEVFNAEGLPEEYDDLVLGAIYTGGCSVSTHAKNALNDLTYDYWVKNDGSTADGSWIKTEDPTMREVLENENWDIVLLQEMNTSSAREEYFQNDNIEKVFTFVVNTLGYEPEFMWNMIWANPEIPESYVNYLYKDGDDGSGSEVGSGSEGDDNDTSDTTTAAKLRAWIFQTQAPTALETWGKNYVKLWENTRQVMYENIVSNVQNYVIGKPVHNITAEDVMPNATAIQYAIEWMGMHEQDMYRDYTHVSDLGRLTVAYLWYAKLTGKASIGAPEYTLVSQVLENSRQPLGYAKDYSQYSDVIQQSVNFALANPYGVIQNLTYAEYLALTADEQAAYKASFDTFSVNSGWTYEEWREAAVAGVTYTDYVRMTDAQKTDYAALLDDFDTWYNGVVESLTYAEYFVLTDEEKTAYAEQNTAFAAWLTEASAAFTYTDYVMMTYEQQIAYQATFAEGEFDTLYADWLANMTYEEYGALTMHQKLQYKKTYSSTDAFLAWYNVAKAAYEA